MKRTLIVPGLAVLLGLCGAVHAQEADEHPATGRVMRFETELPADIAGLVAGFRALG